MVTAPQVLLAVGMSKIRLPMPHSLVLFAAQVIVGPRVSTKAMVWLQVLLLPHGSVAAQVRVATNVLPQPWLVTVLRIAIVMVPQVLLAEGVSKVRLPMPHSLVLFAAQVREGPRVSTKAMVWLQVLLLPHG